MKKAKINLKEASNRYLEQIIESDQSIDSLTDPMTLELEKAWQNSLNSSSHDRGLSPKKSLPEIICNYLNNGQYPPPEIMLALRDAFDTYFNSEEKPTLDELLLPPTRQRAGEYRDILRKEKAFKYYRNLRNHSKNKGKAKQQILKEFNFRRWGFISSESFQQAYSRYNTSKK